MADYTKIKTILSENSMKENENDVCLNHKKNELIIFYDRTRILYKFINF